MKRKKLATIIAFLALALLLSFTACSNDDDELAPGEIIEVTLFEFGGPGFGIYNWDSPVGQRITELTGVRLIHDAPVGDWNEALALMIAGGNLPDMVGHTGNSFGIMVDAGVLRPKREQILAAPNITSLLGDEVGRLAFSLDDPEFYAFGWTPRYNAIEPSLYAENGFFVQFSALEHSGFPAINSWDDFEAVIAAYVEANPTINGMPTVGISFAMADGWRWEFSILNTMTNTSGFPSDGMWNVNEDTLEVTASMRRPESMEFFRWLNHLYDIGLLDPEIFTQTHDDLDAKVASGRVIGFMDAWWQYYSSIGAVVADDPMRNYLGFPVLMDPANMEWRDLQSTGLVVGGAGFSITTSASDATAQRIVDFFDFLASDEGQRLRTWGIEGVHYTFDANDTSQEWVTVEGNPRRVCPRVWEIRTATTDVQVIRAETGVGRYVSQAFYYAGGAFILRDGTHLHDHPMDPMEYFYSQDEATQHVLSQYGILGLNGLFPRGMPWYVDQPVLPRGQINTLPTGQTVQTAVAMENYRDMIPSRVARAVMASPADFDAEWASFMSDLDGVGLRELEEELTTALRDRMSLWFDY